MPGVLRDLVRLQPQPGAHRVAVRAGISVLVPLLVVLALGRPEWSLYAVFGAFTAVYGRNHVHLPRVVMQAGAGAALTLAVALGTLVGTLGHREPVAVLGTAVVAGIGVRLAAVQDWHPPGPLFLVFAFGATAAFPHRPADVAVAVAVAGATAGFAVLVGNAGALLRRDERPRTWVRTRHLPADPWLPAQFALAVLISGAVATGLGIGHPYWATVAAAAPLTGHGSRGQLVRGLHRLGGTMVGLVSAAVLLSLGLGAVATVLVAAALQIVTELLVGRNYGLALVFITPMALLMGQIAVVRPVGPLLVDRALETVIGTGVTLALVAVGVAVRRRRAS